MLPKLMKFIVIKAQRGRTGNIDSIIIKKHAKIGAQNPIDATVVSIQSVIFDSI